VHRVLLARPKEQQEHKELFKEQLGQLDQKDPEVPKVSKGFRERQDQQVHKD
jgi:hypothetical protein